MERWNKTSCFEKLKEELKHSYRYYYERGDQQYKADYRALLRAIMEFEDSVIFEVKDMAYYKRLYRECTFDNPLLFYVYNAACSINSDRAKIIFDYSCNQTQAEYIYEKIFFHMKEIRNLCNVRQESLRVRAVHDYIVKHVEYDDNDKLPVHQAHSFFVYGKAVCDGISKAAKILLDSVGIKSVIIKGDGVVPDSVECDTGHKWNIIWIDDIPDHFDFTFDTNLSSSRGIIRYDYYGLSDEQIMKDHSFQNIGIHTYGKNNWYLKNGLYFTKKSEIRKCIKNTMDSNKNFLSFRLPFTENPKSTLAEVKEIITNELYLYKLKSFSLSINEPQMTVCIYI